MIHRERLTASIDGDFVVFLIGMRLNQPWKVHKWWPLASAMPRMIGELQRQPELGLLHAEMWFSRTLIMVQYWRSMDQLMAGAYESVYVNMPAFGLGRAGKLEPATGRKHSAADRLGRGRS